MTRDQLPKKVRSANNGEEEESCGDGDIGRELELQTNHRQFSQSRRRPLLRLKFSVLNVKALEGDFNKEEGPSP